MKLSVPTKQLIESDSDVQSNVNIATPSAAAFSIAGLTPAASLHASAIALHPSAVSVSTFEVAITGSRLASSTEKSLIPFALHSSSIPSAMS